MSVKKLLLGVLLAAGCGSSTPSPLSGGGLDRVEGPQRVRFVSVAYVDTPAPPYGDQNLHSAAQRLDDIVKRNSSGAAWVEAEFANVTLAGDQAAYSVDRYEDQSGQPLSGRLELDCLAASPSESIGFPFRIFLTPTRPRIFLGFTAVAAGFCSDALLGIDGLPIPHEFGHCLGMAHDGSPGFIMFPDTVAHWDQDYSPASRARVGWR